LTTAIQLAHAAAHYAARRRPKNRRFPPLPHQHTEPGISVVIPSRNGKELLAAQLPGLVPDLPEAAEILVIDNGSDDATAQWLQSSWPRVRVEVTREPLSFARAVNRGLAASRFSHICLLNNDMLLDPRFFQSLWEAFRKVPDLFCATAQIRFPPGVRREETGKAVMAQSVPEDFPIRCDEPVAGEDLTYVLWKRRLFPVRRSETSGLGRHRHGIRARLCGRPRYRLSSLAVRLAFGLRRRGGGRTPAPGEFRL